LARYFGKKMSIRESSEESSLFLFTTILYYHRKIINITHLPLQQTPPLVSTMNEFTFEASSCYAYVPYVSPLPYPERFFAALPTLSAFVPRFHLDQ
jgi:hypothetical protein